MVFARFAARVISASSNARSASLKVSDLLLLVDERIGRLLVCRRRCRLFVHRVRLVLQERRVRIPQAETRILERIEIVAFAHPHERLAPVVHLLEIVERLLHRRKRDVRVVAQLGRCLPSPCRVSMISLGFSPLPGDLVDRFVEALAVVGHVDARSTTDRSRRCRTDRLREAGSSRSS